MTYRSVIIFIFQVGYVGIVLCQQPDHVVRVALIEMADTGNVVYLLCGELAVGAVYLAEDVAGIDK